jgi:hypothetical protein
VRGFGSAGVVGSVVGSSLGSAVGSESVDLGFGCDVSEAASDASGLASSVHPASRHSDRIPAATVDVAVRTLIVMPLPSVDQVSRQRRRVDDAAV